MLSDLHDYESTELDYDDETLKPTDYAFARVRSLLSEADTFLQSAFPLGTVFPDGDGGIRVEWVRPSREIKLIVRSAEDKRSYIFHKQGVEYGGDYDVTSETLGCWLNWLNNDEKPYHPQQAASIAS